MSFTFATSSLDGVVVITPRVFADGRGSFLETYKVSEFVRMGITDRFVQDNHSCSLRGVIRGMHYQKNPCAQAKLIRVSRGAIFDVAVDIRRGSPGYGRWYGNELSTENRQMLYVPAGFAHGFVALTDEADVHYKTTSEYCRATEAGFAWNDPAIGINWPIASPLLSEKDAILPPLAEAENNFVYQG